MNEILKQMKQFDNKQQLKFLLSNPSAFVGDPLLFILVVSDTLQASLSYHKYLTLMNNIALQKRNTALLKATESAMLDVENIDI